jgi:hypothetical protein
MIKTLSTNMKHTPQQLFPTWYKKVELALTQDTISKRMSSLNAIVDEDDLNFWISVTQLYLGIPPSDTAHTKFVEFFTDVDPVFPIEDNDNLLRILASAALSFKLHDEHSYLTYSIALAILNANFLEQFDLLDVVYVQQYASENLANSGEVLRTVADADVSTLDVSLANIEVDDEDGDSKAEVQALRESVINLIAVVKKMDEQQTNLAEETDTLWWLYGAYSSVGDDTFEKVGLPKMILFSALELYEKTRSTVGLIRSKEFLNKVLFSANKKLCRDDVELYKVVNSFSLEERELVNKYYKPQYSQLTPCLAAFKISTELSAKEDWDMLYRSRSHNATSKTNIKPTNLAYQIYNELMFLCSL